MNNLKLWVNTKRWGPDEARIKCYWFSQKNVRRTENRHITEMQRWTFNGAWRKTVVASVKCDVCSVKSFATRHLHQQQSTHWDNTRASCPLVAIETQIRETRILSAHEGEVGVVSSPPERTAVRVPESEHETDQRLYTSWHGFGSRKGFEILVFATDASRPALATTQRSRDRREAGKE
jgi:hypothetical protein